MPSTLETIRAQLRAAANPDKAAYFPRFFKSGPGGYAEGDQFIGVTVPAQRLIARDHYATATLADAVALLAGPIHEERLTALLILVLKYKKGSEADRQAIYGLYLASTARINNWDLVDTSAPYIVGPWLEHRDKSILERLAASDSLWERRIAMLATFHFIRYGTLYPALKSMVKADLIEELGAGQANRRTYTLTPRGRHILELEARTHKRAAGLAAARLGMRF